MLDRGDMHAGRIAEDRTKLGPADLRYQRPDFLVIAFGVAAMEDNARIRIRGAEMDGYRLAAMDTDAREVRTRFQRCLIFVQLSPHSPHQQACCLTREYAEFLLQPDGKPQNPSSPARPREIGRAHV